jgi:hypothetical protein
MTEIFHPEMLNRLADFFPSLCTIQERTEAQDPVTGEVTYSWADIADMTDIPCSHGPNGGVEVKQSDQTYVVSNYTLALSGDYRAAQETMRAVIDGTVFDILLVEHNSHSMKTRLLTRVVE